MGGPTGKAGAVLMAVPGGCEAGQDEPAWQRKQRRLWPCVGATINVPLVRGGVVVPFGGVGEWVVPQARLVLS